MPSYTSSSEESSAQVDAAKERPFARAVCLWFILAALLLLVLEAGTRVGFHRISRIESRTAAEYTQVQAIRGPVRDGAPVILLLGNSLLLEGVDYDRIRTLMQRDARVVRFVIENTDYLDWYYGIRRLLAEGSRPAVIVLCLNTQQLRSSAIRGRLLQLLSVQNRRYPRRGP